MEREMRFFCIFRDDGIILEKLGVKCSIYFTKTLYTPNFSCPLNLTTYNGILGPKLKIFRIYVSIHFTTCPRSVFSKPTCAKNFHVRLFEFYAPANDIWESARASLTRDGTNKSIRSLPNKSYQDLKTMDEDFHF